MVPHNGNLVEGRPWAALVVFFALIVNLVFVAVWDAVCIFRGCPEWTVSDVFQAWAERLPLVPFGFGFIIAHLLGLTTRRQ